MNSKTSAKARLLGGTGVMASRPIVKDILSVQLKARARLFGPTAYPQQHPHPHPHPETKRG